MSIQIINTNNLILTVTIDTVSRTVRKALIGLELIDGLVYFYWHDILNVPARNIFVLDYLDVTSPVAGSGSALYDLLLLMITPGPYGNSWVINETPAGTIDGVNVDYTTASNYLANKLCVYYNGLRIVDYSETGANMFRVTTPPIDGDILLVDYMI